MARESGRRTIYQPSHHIMRRQFRRYRVYFLLLLGAALLAPAVVALRNAGTWLVVSDPMPERLDVLFSFDGDRRRHAYALSLARRFPESMLLLSRHGGREGLASLLSGKDDGKRVYIVDTCSSTLSEVKYLAHWLRVNSVLRRDTGVSSVAVGLVSSPFHMRRIEMLARCLLERDGALCHLLPVPDSMYVHGDDDYGRWWTDKQLRSRVLREYLKLFADRIRVMLAVTPGQCMPGRRALRA